MENSEDSECDTFVKLNLDTLTKSQFYKLLKYDFWEDANPVIIGKFIKYFSYFFNDPNIGLRELRLTVHEKHIDECTEERWNKLNTDVPIELWQQLVVNEYVPIKMNYIIEAKKNIPFTKENIETIVNHTHLKKYAQGIASLLKDCSKLLNDKPWGLNLLSDWCKNNNVNTNKITNLWKNDFNNQEKNNDIILYYKKYIERELLKIKPIECNNLMKLINSKENKNKVVNVVEKLTDEEDYYINELCTCQDSKCANVLYKLIGNDIVCINSKTLDYYVFNDKNNLWEEKTENILYNTISKPLLNYTDRPYEIIKKQIENSNNEKFKSDNELLLKKLVKVRHELGKSPFIERIIKWLRNDIIDRDFTKKLNKIPYLLPLKNNLVINLKTGKTEKRLKEHYFTFECNISYGNIPDENGNIPNHIEEIKQFYLDIAGGDIKLCKLYQIIFGLCLTGEMEKIIFIIYGKGNNGKSVIMRILKRILGSVFYSTLNKAIFIESKGFTSANAHTSYLQSIMESRVGVAGEVTGNDKLNTSLLKTLSGCDGIKGRECMEKKEYEIQSQSKVIIPVNDIPEFPPEDDALIDRLVVAPATIKFINLEYVIDYNEDIDLFSDKFPYVLKNLEKGHRYKNQELSDNMEKNEEYLNDIFKWMVEGAMLYYKEGIIMPECVIEAKKQCILNNDKLQQFLNEILIREKLDVITPNCVKVKDVLIKYQEGGRINTSPKAVTEFCKQLRHRKYEVKPKGKTGDERSQHIFGYTMDDTADDTSNNTADKTFEEHQTKEYKKKQLAGINNSIHLKKNQT